MSAKTIHLKTHTSRLGRRQHLLNSTLIDDNNNVKYIIIEILSTKEFNKKRKKMAKSEPDGCQAIAGILGIIIVAIIYMMGSCNSKDEEINGSKLDAWVKTQYIVESRLKSPGTAKYPWGYSDYVTQDGNKYTIKAYVDAQNSFGATVRTYFICHLKYELREYKLINIHFYQR